MTPRERYYIHQDKRCRKAIADGGYGFYLPFKFKIRHSFSFAEVNKMKRYGTGMYTQIMKTATPLKIEFNFSDMSPFRFMRDRHPVTFEILDWE